MKTTRTLALLMGLIAIFVIVSCKKTDLKNEPGDNVTGKAPTSIVQQETIPSVVLPDCNTHCIDPGGPYVESTDSYTQTWGNPANPQHWKTVSHTAYNTATSFIVEVTFSHSGGNSSNTVSVTAYGSTQSVATLASGSSATFTFALPTGWNACDNVPFSIHQEGQNSPLNLSYSYSLYGICANRGCETSFTGEAIACGTDREAVYTFTSKDALSNFKIQGGLTNFTGADAIVTVTGGTTTQSQWTVGGSSNRVIKVEGSIGECETITIHITWNSTNSGGVITGSWSVKDSNGVEIAPAVTGLTCD